MLLNPFQNWPLGASKGTLLKQLGNSNQELDPFSSDHTVFRVSGCKSGQEHKGPRVLPFLSITVWLVDLQRWPRTFVDGFRLKGSGPVSCNVMFTINTSALRSDFL